MTLETTRTRTQADRLRAWLESGKPITPIEALRQFGCFRLGARVYDLKKEGMAIEKQMVKTEGGAYVAQYRLAQ